MENEFPVHFDERLSTICILDVGCRYGVYPTFKKHINKMEYLGVDADSAEVERLKTKYKRSVNLKFFDIFLTNEDKKVKFYLSAHKGYNSSKKKNTDSLWFGSIRQDEARVEKELSICGVRSGGWVNENATHANILKLDIEGGELEFLNGLDDFSQFEAIIAECLFDDAYQTDSNFSSISNKLAGNGYFLASAEVEEEKFSRFCTEKDSIPVSATSIFLKRQYLPHRLKNVSLTNIELLFCLGLDGLLIESIQNLENKEMVRESVFYDEIKFHIGHRFNSLQKSPHFTYEELNSIFKSFFSEELPSLSNFYESAFFNPS